MSFLAENNKHNKKGKQAMSTINIAIGHFPFDQEHVTSWEIIDTSAPKDYDGFGTFAVHEYEGTRTVLIRTEHWAWQTARYASGNHWHKPSTFEPDDIQKVIWDRILGRTE